MPRKGDWIQTYTGRVFYPLDPQPDDVHLLDIAHALAMKCRFSGHTTHFYSVAEHSIAVSHCVPPEDALWGLLHDASEAYSADIPRPLKNDIREWWEPIERRIMEAICVKYNLPLVEPASVKEADSRILANEKDAFLHPSDIPWSYTPKPLSVSLKGLYPTQAKEAFIARFAEIKTGLG